MKIKGREVISVARTEVRSIQRFGGERDGETWHTVQATVEDGSVYNLWVCESKPGLFKQVLVPANFEHPAMVE